MSPSERADRTLVQGVGPTKYDFSGLFPGTGTPASLELGCSLRRSLLNLCSSVDFSASSYPIYSVMIDYVDQLGNERKFKLIFLCVLYKKSRTKAEAFT